MMLRVPLLMLALSCLVGCTTIPFDPEPQADFRDADPQVVVDAFSAAVGTRYEMLESVVVCFFGQEIAGMGYLLIDAETDAYALACMSPSGMKIMEFKAKGDDLDMLFMMPQLEKHGQRAAESISADIRRINFGWTPDESALPRIKRHQIQFTERSDQGRVEYTYSGADGVLTRKRFRGRWRTSCDIRYFDYRNIGGKLYPHGVLVHNKKLHYKLIIRVKSVLPTAEAETVGPAVVESCI